ncbi:MAG: hypothetical protein Tsb002_37220 [Wenzhouxiangellaceae bacterium]
MQWLGRNSLGIMVFTLMAGAAQAQEVTLFFDGTGIEAGTTGPGAGNFSFAGSTWSGGLIRTQGVLGLYASGAFSYHAPATVTFDRPMTDVRFFYVHGSGNAPGTAIARDANGAEVGRVNTRLRSLFADPNNFVEFDSDTPILSVEFSNGVIDNFSYRPADDIVDFDFQSVEGSWLNPQVVGSGILFDYGPSIDMMIVTWVTHSLMREIPQDPPPGDDIGFSGQRSLNALLSLQGNTGSGRLFIVEGGQFDTPPDGNQRTREVGDISVQFSGCNAGVVDYSIDNPPLSGSFDIVQLESVVSNGFVCGDDGGQ